jgi:hypothetical protein
MRIAAACIALVAAAVALTGCTVQVAGHAAADPAAAAAAPTTPPAPTTPQAQALGPDGRFTDSQGRFAITPPPGWTVDASGQQGTAVVFFDLQAAGGTTNRMASSINVFTGPSELDLDGTIADLRQQLQSFGGGYTYAVDQAVTLADGTPAHMVGGSFTDPSKGFPVRNLQVVSVQNGVAVVATGTALQDVWPSVEQAVQASLLTLSVTG